MNELNAACVAASVLVWWLAWKRLVKPAAQRRATSGLIVVSRLVGCALGVALLAATLVLPADDAVRPYLAAVGLLIGLGSVVRT